jgi:glycosyltransferase involved in cell wall biosynthesis
LLLFSHAWFLVRIDLVFPKLPPALDGIGDHTARLAAALAARGHGVRVLTAQPEADRIPGVSVERAFSLHRRRGVRRVAEAVQSDPPDWLLVQFNQFSYGRWGFNPHLPLAVRRMKRQQPGVRVAVLFHEDFLPVTSWRNAVMTTWQRAQFWALGRLADVAAFSIEPWAQTYRRWFPQAEVVHWPVGSNIPREGTGRAEAKAALGISGTTLVAGVFGTLHASRMLPFIARAVRGLWEEDDREMTVLYVGPDGKKLKAALPSVPVRDAGRLPAEAVSRHLAAMDVHLAPFVDGASTRRGSLMAGLQHGVATLTTCGPLTDRTIRKADGDALLLTSTDDARGFAQRAVRLAARPQLRAGVAEAGRALYDRAFSWEVLSRRVEGTLCDAMPAAPEPHILQQEATP